MRLGIFHPAFGAVRGAEMLAATHAQYYRGQGVAAEIVTFEFDEARWRPMLGQIPVHTVRKRHWTDLFLGMTPEAKLRRRGRRAAEAIASHDVVVAHNFPSSAMLGDAPVRARKVWQCNEPPRSLHWRDANPALARYTATGGNLEGDAARTFSEKAADYDHAMARKQSLWARRAYDLHGAEGLDLIYAISEYSRDIARRVYGRCWDEVVFPLVRFPEEGSRRRGLERTVRRVLVHSRLEDLKNIDTVIRGFRRFLDASSIPCELHVVGEGPARSRLESMAAHLCPGGEVVFHGYLPDGPLRRVYEACDVFALLPLDEPFGMVFPEAAARGLLLVGPDHGGPMEILDGGRLGWTVDAFAPEALSDVLSQIWTLDDAEVDRRREAADRACRSRFGLESVGPKLMKVIGAV